MSCGLKRQSGVQLFDGSRRRRNQLDRRAGGDAGSAIMLGDHPNDVAAARGAGVPAIFALWGYGLPAMAEAAAAHAASPGDIPALVALLLA